MLIKNTHNGIYERILTDRNGRLVRVQFAIIETSGIVRGRVISVMPVISVVGKIGIGSELATTASPGQFYLPALVQSGVVKEIKTSFVKTRISPYTSFEFFMSQPTRAPSL
jgi:hypothetical protein